MLPCTDNDFTGITGIIYQKVELSFFDNGG